MGVIHKLFKIRAHIYIHKDGGRKTPIHSGYRPGFVFIEEQQTSGAIDLLDRSILMPGETATVEVRFASDQLLGAIKPSIEVAFYEGPLQIGKAKVLEVLGWEERS